MNYRDFERQRKQRRDEMCALRFDLATAQAENAVAQVSADRWQRRLQLRHEGFTCGEIDARMADEIAAVREVLPMFTEWPMRSRNWGDDWRGKQYNEAMEDMMSVTRAVVWELWHDFGEWPSWYPVASRISTWLDTDLSDSSMIAEVPQYHDTHPTGITIEHPYHLRPPSKRPTVARWAWRLDSYEQMVLQERIFQWRIVLGDDGLRYRTPLASLLEGLHDSSVPL